MDGASPDLSGLNFSGSIFGIFFGHLLGHFWRNFGSNIQLPFRKSHVRKMDPFHKRPFGGSRGSSWEVSGRSWGCLWRSSVPNLLQKNTQRMFSKTQLFAIIALLGRFQEPSWLISRNFGRRNSKNNSSKIGKKVDPDINLFWSQFWTNFKVFLGP